MTGFSDAFVCGLEGSGGVFMDCGLSDASEAARFSLMSFYVLSEDVTGGCPGQCGVHRSPFFGHFEAGIVIIGWIIVFHLFV